MKKTISILFASSYAFSLFAQNKIIHPGVDTTGEQFKIGQRIGGWLPVVVIIFVLLLYIRHSYKNGKYGNRG